jgi:RNA polymerase sigma-70 factor (ECF subfamily)
MLVQALQDGEELAFTEIYDRYFQPLYITAYKILHHTEGAEDVVQDTFLSLWKYRHNLQIENLAPYLHQSARHAVIKVCQRKKTDVEFYQRLARATVILLHPDPLADQELQEILVRTIHALPVDQQVIYNMSRESAMTYQQIADKLGISIKTVEKKMSLSLKLLRNVFNQSLKIFASLLFFSR